MSSAKRPCSPHGRGDCQDQRESCAPSLPPQNTQSFEDYSFGRMDAPTIPSALIHHTTEAHAVPPYRTNSFTASINDDPFVIDDILASPLDQDFRKQHPVAPSSTRHGEAYEINHFSTQPRSEKLYHEALPGEITPYMGLRGRLTQIPINRWTVLLLLVLARLIILFESLHRSLTEAQQEATSACASVEDMGSALVSVPHYASAGVNELVAMRMSDTVRALINVISMVLSGILELFMFMIERTYGTIACVAITYIEALIQLAELAVKMFIQGIDDALEDVTAGIADAVSDVAGGLDKTLHWIDDNVLVKAAAETFGLSIPNVDGVNTAVDVLRDAKFIDSTAVFKSIDDFHKEIPDFKQITTDVQAVIGLPFVTVQNLLNESFGNWSMDSSVFPTAPKENLTFCTGNDNITDLFEVLFIISKSAKIIATAGLLVATLLTMAFMLWWEVQRYRRTVVRSQIFRDCEPMDTVYLAGRPLSAGAGLWISKKVFKDPDRQMLMRWVVAYATTYTTLFVLALAVAGAFSALCQYFIMRAIQKETPGLSKEVGTFVTNALSTLGESSMRWANESNQAILDVQNDINDHVLVYVQSATGAVINLINTFENDTTTFLKDFFGNSAIGQVADNFTEKLLDCIVIDALEKAKSGMEWVNSEAHVTFPEFPADIFSVGATNDGNTSFGALLANSGLQTANDITGALNKTVIMLQSGIIQEGLIALVLFLLYVTYVLFAAAQAALRMCCLRGRKPLQDAEKQVYTADKPRHANFDIQGDMANTPRRASMSTSYRLSHPDVSQLARDLSVVSPKSIVSVKRSSATVRDDGHATKYRYQHAASEDPLGDEWCAIDDDEVADMVHVLGNSGKMIAEDARLRYSQSIDDNAYAIGDKEVDGIVGALHSSEVLVDGSRAQNRQAWVEDLTDE